MAGIIHGAGTAQHTDTHLVFMASPGRGPTINKGIQLGHSCPLAQVLSTGRGFGYNLHANREDCKTRKSVRGVGRRAGTAGERRRIRVRPVLSIRERNVTHVETLPNDACPSGGPLERSCKPASGASL